MNGIINYQDGTTPLKGYLQQPQKSAVHHPGVIILPAWMGLSEHEKEVSKKLAEAGYITLVADVYGNGKIPVDTKEASSLTKDFETNYQKYLSRINAAIAEIIKHGADKDHLVVIGYCFGGFGAIEAARANLPVLGIASFHGSLLPDPSGSTSVIKPKLLIMHGTDDPFQRKGATEAIQEEMKTRKADWQMIFFGNAVHSFTDPAAGNDNSKGSAYNAKADKRSWNYLMNYLREINQ